MKDPNYGNLGDHTETLQIDFDPQRITYAQLLAVFWKSHEAGSQSWSRQYQNAIFYHDDQQRRQAIASKAAVEEQTGAKVHSEVASLNTFYLAEDYHQKYLLKQHASLSDELHRIYPREKDFVDSTAAARINGYVGGYGGPDQLAREIDLLGLSPQTKHSLIQVVHTKFRLN